MQRYFGNIISNQVALSDDDCFHLVKVMRAIVGDQIEVVDSGKVFLCTVTSIKPLKIEINKEIKEDHNLPNKVVLICALLKGEKIDFVLQKATELGVNEIVFFNSERTIVKMNSAQKESKYERFRKILKEASEQSKRNDIPILTKLIDFKDIAKLKLDRKYIAYEGYKGKPNLVKEVAPAKPGQIIGIIIGPEGGFSEAEYKFAKEKGFKPVSLGKRILRAETAAIYALSVIGNTLESR